MDIRIEKNRQFKLVGVTANTSMGFRAIGMCWGSLHQRKSEIGNRTAPNLHASLMKTQLGYLRIPLR